MAPCIVVGCKTGYGPNSPKFQVIKFPEGKVLRQKWIDQINRDGLKPLNLTKDSVVCERHFEESAFKPQIGYRGQQLKKKHLKEWAYPTLFLRPEKEFTPRVTSNSSKAKDQPLLSETPKDESAGKMESPTSWLGIDNDHDYDVFDETEIQKEEVYPPAKKQKVNLCCCSDSDCHIRQENCDLKEQLDQKSKEIDALKKELEEMKKHKDTVDAVKRVFNTDQINRMLKPSSRAAWSNKTLQSSIQLYYTCGAAAYELLREKYPVYPSKRCLQNHLSKIEEA